MLTGTVLFIHRNSSALSTVERLLTAMYPGIHTEWAACGAQGLTIQSVMRPRVIVMEMEQPDMTGEHLLCEMKRDIIQPYILAVDRTFSTEQHRRLLVMGANEVLQEPLEIENTALRIAEMMRGHGRKEGKCMPEKVLQRLFADSGIPFDLKGYRYLKCAIELLDMGVVQMDPIGRLYEKIGERYGCMAAAVERNIRYAIRLCVSNMNEAEKVGNRQFIARLMAQKEPGVQTICSPRVSVFCSERRVFR